MEKIEDIVARIEEESELNEFTESDAEEVSADEEVDYWEDLDEDLEELPF